MTWDREWEEEEREEDRIKKREKLIGREREKEGGSQIERKERE